MTRMCPARWRGSIPPAVAALAPAAPRTTIRSLHEGDAAMPNLAQAARPALPEDAANATLAGRVWRPDAQGPSVVAIRDNMAFDVSGAFPTMRDLTESS